jgi:hypothetical protein
MRRSRVRRVTIAPESYERPCPSDHRNFASRPIRATRGRPVLITVIRDLGERGARGAPPAAISTPPPAPESPAPTPEPAPPQPTQAVAPLPPPTHEQTSPGLGASRDTQLRDTRTLRAGSGEARAGPSRRCAYCGTATRYFVGGRPAHPICADEHAHPSEAT